MIVFPFKFYTFSICILISFHLSHVNLNGRDEAKQLLKQASDDEAVGIAILVTVMMVSPIIIILVKNAVATIQVGAILSW